MPGAGWQGLRAQNATLSRMLRSPLMLRVLIYVTAVVLSIYGLLYITQAREPFTSIIPDYINPNASPEANVPTHVVTPGAGGTSHTAAGGSGGGDEAKPPMAMPTAWKDRAGVVKKAFQHAYGGYARYAAPSDELRPLSNGKINNFNGWGVTAFDSLDTMLLMGLSKEYETALDIVKGADFSKAEPSQVPFFETVIRYVGGLLSAYTMTKDATLLARAEDLVKHLDPVFDTPTGFPYYSVDPASGATVGPDLGILAEIASLQLEYTYLAKLTGNAQYHNRSETIMKALASADLKNTGGMFPVKWNIMTGLPFAYHVSVGAQADSAHEYLLKMYLLTGKKDKTSLEMYIRMTTHLINNLLYLSPTRHLLYVTDTDMPTFDSDDSPSHVFEHLSCFLPGLLALGVDTLPLDNLESLGIDLDVLGSEKMFGAAGKGYKKLKSHNLRELHLWAAEGLATTCWMTYADQASGLAPDEVMMTNPADREATYKWIDAVEKWRGSGARGVPPGLEDHKPVVYTESQRLHGTGRGRDYVLRRAGYLLRPETIESLYILWRVTGDEKWRNRGWAIFEAIERETKTPSGYASLQRVDTAPPQKKDDMPSYFLAETLKYLYLLCLDEDPLPLDEWVFNTEAHPFPVFDWTEQEKTLFNIPF